jgi:hypothetical protein
MFGFGGFLTLFAFPPLVWGAAVVFVANVFASIHGTLNRTAIQHAIPTACARISSS